MDRRSLLKSALLVPVAMLAAKLGARAAEPELFEIEPYRCYEDQKRLQAKAVYQTTDPKATLPPNCGSLIRRYQYLDGKAVELIHPYDLYELLIGRTKDLSLVQSFYKLQEFEQNHGLIRLNGNWYKQTTYYPPVTKRFA